MKQELLNTIKPQIKVKAESIYRHFEELANEERQSCIEEYSDNQIEGWIEEKIYETEFFNGCFIDIDEDIQELIANDFDLQYEFDELVSSMVLGYMK